MTTNMFDAYFSALERVNPESGYQPVEELFYERPDYGAQLAEELNRTLGFGEDAGERRFQADVPLIGLGSWRGVVLLSANPGYRDHSIDPRNAREDEYRRRSLDACTRFTRDFFEVHPEVLGKRLRFWSSAIDLLAILGWERVRRASGMSGEGRPRTTAHRWDLAHHSRLLGGWELLPWHSEKDGFGSGVVGPRADDRIRCLCEASFRAVLRTQPEVLIVASAAGYELALNLLKHETWQTKTISKVRGGREVSVPIARCVASGVAVIAVGWQMFARYSPLKPADLIEIAYTLGHPRAQSA